MRNTITIISGCLILVGLTAIFILAFKYELTAPLFYATTLIFACKYLVLKAKLDTLRDIENRTMREYTTAVEALGAYKAELDILTQFNEKEQNTIPADAEETTSED